MVKSQNRKGVFFIEVNLKEADGGFIVGCPAENTDHIFVTFSDAIDFILKYFEKDDSDDPKNHKFADSPKEA